MTADDRFILGIIVTVAANAALIGAAWGNLKAGQAALRDEVCNIRKALGLKNGQPGLFVTREELKLMREAADNERDDIRRRIGGLEDREA